MRNHNQPNENNSDPENIDFNSRTPQKNTDHYNNPPNSQSPRSTNNYDEDYRGLVGNRHEQRENARSSSSNYSQGGHGPQGSSRYSEDRDFRNNRGGDNNDNRDYRLNRDYNRGHWRGRDEHYESPDTYRDNLENYSDYQGQFQNTYEGQRFRDTSMEPSFNRHEQRGYQYGSDDYRPEKPTHSRRRHYDY